MRIPILAVVQVCAAVFFVAYMALSAPAMAATLPVDAVVLRDPLGPDDLRGHIVAYRDPTRSLTVEDILKPGIIEAFQPVDQRAPDFGYTHDVIWLAVRLRNDQTDIPDWRLHVRENFLQLFEVYAASEGQEAILIEAQDEHSPYATRRISYPELVAGLSIAPGTETTVFIRYWSGGSSEISFSILSEKTFNALASRKTAKNFVYYGMLLFLVIAASIASVITGRRIFGSYAAYAGFGLLFVMHGDGNTFQYLWPGLPVFNSFASIPLGTGLIVFGGIFARSFLQTRQYHRVFDTLILGFITTAVALALSGLVWDAQQAKKLLVLFSFLSMILYALAGFNAARTRFHEVRFYVLAWTGAVIASGMMTARHWFGIDISEEAQFDAMRIVLVLDAGLIGFAILDRFNQLKQAREEALRTSLAGAKRNLRLSNRLRDLEQKYGWAVKLAENREREAADVVHDLREPLHALRLSVQAAATGRQGDDRSADIEDTFGYLENLVSEFLDTQARATGQSDRSILQAEEDTDPQVDACDIDEIISGVVDIHLADAEAKDIDLRHVPCGLHTPLPPLVLMRIVANLVSNAVKYTPSGRILVGVRRMGAGRARVEVHDTGIGMSQDQFTEALARSVRLGETGSVKGAGLGLSIVTGLADKHNLTVRWLARTSQGTSVGVTIPVLDPSAQ